MHGKVGVLCCHHSGTRDQTPPMCSGTASWLRPASRQHNLPIAVRSIGTETLELALTCLEASSRHQARPRFGFPRASYLGSPTAGRLQGLRGQRWRIMHSHMTHAGQRPERTAAAWPPCCACALRTTTPRPALVQRSTHDAAAARRQSHSQQQQQPVPSPGRDQRGRTRARHRAAAPTVSVLRAPDAVGAAVRHSVPPTRTRRASQAPGTRGRRTNRRGRVPTAEPASSSTVDARSSAQGMTPLLRGTGLGCVRSVRVRGAVGSCGSPGAYGSGQP
mmetsp:Transcript_8036/g.22121  ORF Transcript_8036/g.22121 Transcript_8036/m.22121 type:complete len:276 (-) Transcript_8036:112-939(-)